MIRGLMTFATMLSVLLFPWPVPAVLAVGGALAEPLLPLAVGLFADALFYAPREGALPLFTIFGAVATLGAFFVRSQMRAGIIGE